MIRRYFLAFIMLSAVVILSLPRLSPAADLYLEKDLLRYLTQSKAVVMRMERKLRTGKPISNEINQIQSLAENISATHVLLQERFRLRREQLKAIGPQALDRHIRMSQNYKDALEEYLISIKDLHQNGIVPLTVIEKLRGLLERILPEKKSPVFGNLPYRNLRYEEVEPLGASPVTPAYQRGNETISADDLKSSPEAAISGEIAALAESLNWSPVLIYEWVKNRIETEWYWGCMKGAEETLRQGSGNDCDQATMLVALLRACGFPSRYVRGIIEFFPDLDKVKNLTGLEDEEEIALFFKKAGIPCRPVREGGKIFNFHIEHIWVESLIPAANYRGTILSEEGKIWFALDTSIKVKEYLYHEPEAPLDPNVFSRIRDTYLSTVRDETPLEYTREKVKEYLGRHYPEIRYEDLLRTKALVPEEMKILPAGLQFKEIVITHEYTRIPDELMHKVRFRAFQPEGGVFFDYSMKAFELSNKSIALTCEPETVEDQEIMNSYGGMSNTPPYLICLRPVLTINGQRGIVGREGLPMGREYALTIDLISPHGVESLTNSHLIMGNFSIIGLVAQRAVLPKEVPGEEKDAERILHETALSYINRWSQSEEELASLLCLNVARPIPTVVTMGGVIEVTCLLDTPLGFEWKGIYMDADLRACETVEGEGFIDQLRTRKTFMEISSLQGSTLEGEVMEENLGVKSISTAKLFGLANDMGIPILTINADNIDSLLTSLNIADIIKDDITGTVNMGCTITIPGQKISYEDWKGTGYIQEVLQTAESGWMISGMIAGAMTVWSFDQWPEYIGGRLKYPFSEKPNFDPEAGVYIRKIIATDRQQGTVGKLLDQSLKVIVFDEKWRRVKGAEVTFTIEAGGGQLKETMVTTNEEGIAGTDIILGEQTSVNPTLLFQSDVPYGQQAGENIINASLVSGTHISAPFAAYGFPDEPQIMKKVSENEGSGRLLGYSGRVAVVIEDQYGNPVSNLPVAFQVRNADDHSICGNPNLDQREALLVKSDDPCMENNLPIWGECGSSYLQQSTNSQGMAAVEVILGGIPEADYPIKASFGNLNQTFHFTTDSFGNCTGDSMPEIKFFIVPGISGDREGKSIHAAQAGSCIPIVIKMYALKEREKWPDTGGRSWDCGDGEIVSCPIAEGSREYELIPDFSFSQVTVAGQEAASLGGGMYMAMYEVSPGPNTIPITGEAILETAWYPNPDPCEDFACHYNPLETVYGPETTTLIVYGVDIRTMSEMTLRVSLEGYIMNDYTIPYTIQPADYQASMALVNILKDGQTVTSIPSQGKGPGRAVISRACQFDFNSTYEIEIVLNSDTGGVTKSGRFPLTLIQDTVDLDVDSDNDDDFGLPEGDVHEDSIEDIEDSMLRAALEGADSFPFPLGKVIEINKNDTDDDGVPDYADGFDLDVFDVRDDVCTDHPGFVPVRLKVDPGKVLKKVLPDLSLLRFTFDYYASDPAAVSLVDERYRLPDTGALRIWKKEGHVPRNGDGADIGGDFVNADIAYSPQELGMDSPDNLETIFYLEAVSRGRGKHEKISVRLSLFLDGKWESILSDDIMIDIVSVEFVECNEGPEKFPYKDILSVFSPRPLVTIDDALAIPVPEHGAWPQVIISGTVKTFLAPIENNRVFINGEAVPIDIEGLSDEEANGPHGMGPFVRTFSKQITIGKNNTLGAVVQAVNLVENMGYDMITYTPDRPDAVITGWTKVTHEGNPKDESEALPGGIEDYQFRIEVISSSDEDELEIKIHTGLDPEKALTAKRAGDTNRFLTDPLFLFPGRVGDQYITIPATVTDQINNTRFPVLNAIDDTPEPVARYECKCASGTILSYEDKSTVPVMQIIVKSDPNAAAFSILEENPGHTAGSRLRSPKRWLTKKDMLYFEIKNLLFGKNEENEIKLTVLSQTDLTGQEITLIEQSENAGSYRNKEGSDCIKIKGGAGRGKEIGVTEEELVYQYLATGGINRGHVYPGGQLITEGRSRSLIRSIMVDKGEFSGAGIYYFYLYKGEKKQGDNYYVYPTDAQLAGCDRELLLAEAGTNTNLWQLADTPFPDDVGTQLPSNEFEDFIKSGGTEDNEGDYMHISTHGHYDGALVDEGSPAGVDTIIKPDNYRIEGAIINQTDWNLDMDWVFLATCDQLNNSLNKADPTGAQNWQGALFGWPRHAHGILGSCEPMAGEITSMINTFWSELRAGKSFREAYITGSDVIGHDYAILCHSENKDDTMYDFTADVFGTGGPPATLHHVQKTGSSDGVLREKFENGEFELWAKPFMMPKRRDVSPFQLSASISFEDVLGKPVSKTTDGITMFEIGEFSLDQRCSLTDGQASAKALSFIIEKMGIPPEELSHPVANQITGSILDKSLNVFDSQCVGYEVTVSRLSDGLIIPDEMVRILLCGDEISKVFIRWHELDPLHYSIILSEANHPKKILKRRLRRLRKVLKTGRKKRFKILTCDLSYIDAGQWDEDMKDIYLPVCRLSGIMNGKIGGLQATAYLDISTGTLLHTERRALRGGAMGLENFRKKSFLDVITSVSSTGPERLPFATGDLNGDHKSDLVVIKQGSKSLGVYLGDGSGGWIEKEIIDFPESIGAIIVYQGCIYVGTASYQPEGKKVSVYTLKLSDKNGRILKIQLPLKGLEQDLDLITSLSVRTLAEKTFLAVGGHAQRTKGLEKTTSFYVGGDNGWVKASLDFPCTVSGKAVFADIDDNGKIDILVSGIRKAAERHKKSKGVVNLHKRNKNEAGRHKLSKGEYGTEVFFQREGKFFRTTKPGYYQDFCVVGTGGKDRTFSLGNDVMEFKAAEGWLKTASLEGYEFLAAREEAHIYENEQLVFRKAGKKYEIGNFNCSHLRFFSTKQFPLDPNLSPVLAVALQHGDYIQEAGTVILLSYKRKNNTFITMPIF